jgi:uncharacterized protein with PQ loop repeat
MIYLGFLAASLTTISFIPQVYIVWKTNDTKSISLAMFLLFWIGVLASLWDIKGRRCHHICQYLHFGGSWLYFNEKDIESTK